MIWALQLGQQGWVPLCPVITCKIPPTYVELGWRGKKVIPGVPKKVEWQIFSTLRAKSVICLPSLDKASSAEENDTKIIKFGWVILILFPFLEIQSFSNFCDRWANCCVGTNLPYDVLWSVFLLLPRINGLPQNTIWKVCPDKILCSSVAKIQQNLKITVWCHKIWHL